MFDRAWPSLTCIQYYVPINYPQPSPPKRIWLFEKWNSPSIGEQLVVKFPCSMTGIHFKKLIHYKKFKTALLAIIESISLEIEQTYNCNTLIKHSAMALISCNCNFYSLQVVIKCLTFKWSMNHNWGKISGKNPLVSLGGGSGAYRVYAHYIIYSFSCFKIECFASSTTCNTNTDPNPSQVSSYEECCMTGGSYNQVEGDGRCRECTRSCEQSYVICCTLNVYLYCNLNAVL